MPFPENEYAFHNNLRSPWRQQELRQEMATGIRVSDGLPSIKCTECDLPLTEEQIEKNGNKCDFHAANGTITSINT